MRLLALLYAVLFVVISGCATTSRQPAHSAGHLQDMGEKCLAAGETANGTEIPH